jgi:hypothetical protein
VSSPDLIQLIWVKIGSDVWVVIPITHTILVCFNGSRSNFIRSIRTISSVKIKYASHLTTTWCITITQKKKKKNHKSYFLIDLVFIYFVNFQVSYISLTVCVKAEEDQFFSLISERERYVGFFLSFYFDYTFNVVIVLIRPFYASTF